MDEFTYILRVKELENCVTKKSKVDFIKSALRDLGNWGKDAPYLVKLALHTLTVLDTSTVGVAALPTRINKAVASFKVTQESLDIIGELPKPKVTAGNDYYGFMQSPGIPAYLKMAVHKAEQGYIDERK